MKRKSKISQDVQFVKNDIVRVPRTTQYLKKDGQGTFNAGDLVPFQKIDVLPGDTHSIKLNSLIRTTGPLVKPIAGVMEMHIAAYFIPFRICGRDGDSFMSGYQSNPDGTVDSEKIVPHSKYFSVLEDGKLDNGNYYFSRFDTIFQGSVGDMLGLPCGILVSSDEDLSVYKVISLYARGYCLTWNNGYRDQATQKEISVNIGSIDMFLTGGVNVEVGAADPAEGDQKFTKVIDWYSSKAQNGVDDGNDIYGVEGPLNYGKLCPLNKKRDQFTSALPQPQKGAPVVLNLGGYAPVIADNLGFAPVLNVMERTQGGVKQYDFEHASKSHIQLSTGIGESPLVPDQSEGFPRTYGESLSEPYTHFGSSVSSLPAHNVSVGGSGGNVKDYFRYADLASINPVADLSNATSISVNDLRLSVQTQLVKEIDARYGTRPKEFYYGHFGVLTADARLQIPEYLGSKSILLNINQVVQNSASTEGSPQANLAAFSQTAKEVYLFTKSFTEYGFILLVCGVRSVGGAYSQGIDKSWSKLSRGDHYLPEFDHIGEQPIRNKELFLKQYNFKITEEGTTMTTVGLEPDDVFGYQQAGYEHRFMPNSVHGLMRPDAEGSLAYGNLSYNFKESPTLSPEFIKEDKSLIDRALAYPCINPETGEYTGVDQFQVEFGIQDKATRPMSLHSIPGFMDHSGRILL